MQDRGRLHISRTAMVVGLGIVLAAGIASASSSSTGVFPRYTEGCNIDECHGDFDGPISPKGSIFPADSKHEMHRAANAMATDCLLCHFTPGDQPFTYQSAGTADTPGLGCVGCHGQDYGPGIQKGVGLRLHHFEHDVTFCIGCHPEDPPPLPEDVAPEYYGSPDTLADLSCNTDMPNSGENWSIGDLVGLDNDGDDVYDAADSDCAPCAADLNGDDLVDVTDLLQLLAAWGMCSGCAEDIDGDDQVGVIDLLALIGAWGPC